MKNLNFLKLFLATIFVTTTALFAGCVDDNDDTEAPRLEISPKTLVFNDEGFPVDGSQDYFEISANRKWTATVVDDKTWVTLSKMEGNGSDKVQVSIPEGITDEATVMIQISNKVGVLLTEKVTIGIQREKVQQMLHTQERELQFAIQVKVVQKLLTKALDQTLYSSHKQVYSKLTK